MLKKISLTILACLCVYRVVIASNQWIGYGLYDGLFISETGRVNRDLNLLNMKAHSDMPFFVIGGDLITFFRYPKRSNKPLYLFNEISGELQNVRLNFLLNPNDELLFQANYQINERRLLDAFMTIGDLNRSPWFITLGRQYLSYGDFNKYDVEPNPLTKSIFRVIAPALSLGYKHDNHLLKAILSENRNQYGFLYQKDFKIDDANLTAAIGFLNAIKDNNKVLSTLRVSPQTKAINMYVMASKQPFSMRFELSEAIGRIESMSHLSAYDLEAQYKILLYGKSTKLIASSSGIFPKRLKYNADFKQLGLFAQQYVLSMKRQLNRQLTVGVALICGLNESTHIQGAANIVIKF